MNEDYIITKCDMCGKTTECCKTVDMFKNKNGETEFIMVCDDCYLLMNKNDMENDEHPGT